MPYPEDFEVLPPAALEELWVRAHVDSGVALCDAKELARFVMTGTIEPDQAVFENFVGAAIAAPHYTPVTTLSRITGFGRLRVSRVKSRIINAARAERDKKYDT